MDDIQKDNLMDYILTKSIFKYSPLSPIGLMIDTNRGLENYYKRHNITETPIKNYMRHITGSGQFAKAYSAPVATLYGLLKETTDFWSGNNDNATDLINNDDGRNYVINNPNSTREDLMDYAYNQYKKRQSPLFKLMISN